MEDRRLGCCPIEPQTVGLAGAAQRVRLQRVVDERRGGQGVKHTEETAYGVSSFWPDEADEARRLDLARDHWQIENGQHYRRDRTQDEDRCQVRETHTARGWSLFRSRAIFLYERQRRQREGKRSWPDFERKLCRQPGGLITQLRSASL